MCVPEDGGGGTARDPPQLSGIGPSRAMRVTRQGRRAWEVVASHTRAAQRQLKKELAVEPAHGSKAGARGRGDAPSCSSSLSGRADASPRAASAAMAAPREAGVKASERRSHGEELAFETALEAACRSTDSVGRPLPGRCGSYV